VNLPASLEGRERARLFCALRLPEAALAALSGWQATYIQDGRPVPRDHLHLTLAFLGSRPVGELAAIGGALRDAAGAAGPIRLLPERYRETRSVGIFDGLERLGLYERERRPWLPHVTVVRFRRPLRLRPPLPELGEVSPSDAAVYHSVLRSSGAQYVVVESFALGG
jgi:RNA 2',3'-cyclic 3'-phosphodiesterase